MTTPSIQISKSSRTRTVFKGKTQIGHIWEKRGRWFNAWSKLDGTAYLKPMDAALNLAEKSPGRTA